MHDLKGETYGQWTVLRRAFVQSPYRYWLCQCACGTERAVRGVDLRRSVSKNCGCVRRQQCKTLVFHRYDLSNRPQERPPDCRDQSIGNSDDNAEPTHELAQCVA